MCMCVSMEKKKKSCSKQNSCVYNLCITTVYKVYKTNGKANGVQVMQASVNRKISAVVWIKVKASDRTGESRNNEGLQ